MANHIYTTSAKDKAILEAAYNANPKPDKAARLDIVQRVSLNEKEVQVRHTPNIHRARVPINPNIVTLAEPC